MIDELLARIAAFHRSRTPSPEFPMVAEVLDALDSATAPVEIAPAPPLTVTRHLDVVKPTGANPAMDAVLEEFLRIAHDLPWRRTVGYLDVLSDEYLANYGYVQLMGPPPSIIEHPSVRVGIGVWGPDLDYPMHEHEAEELYHVLAGTPSFADAAGVWTTTSPGDAIHTPPWQRHAQRFGDTPTVVLYCWTGAVEADAVLVESA
jgi:mannose-6-phosphate isomerase-like protein (cupin superfamily)